MNRSSISLLATLVLLSVSALPSLAQSTAQAADVTPPLRRVTLYKHGVGYFERRGKVNGDQQITFSFDAAQMNDVLKSLVVLDLSRGNISAVTFDSTKPLDRRLDEFGISLDRTNTASLTALIGQLRGARVEVKAAAGATTGTIVGIEKRSRAVGNDKAESQDLILMSEGGELRAVALDQIRGIRLLDARLREDVERYLAVLQSTIHKNTRSLTITSTGQGERDLFVSYVVEAPVWKTTYRVVLDDKAQPFLQGWAIVDNVQDEDWTNVSLSLIAGMPVSFIQDLQQPRYKRRPVVEMGDDLTMTPQVSEAAIGTVSQLSAGLAVGGGNISGVITDPGGSVIAGATIRIRNQRTSVETVAVTDSAGRYSAYGLPPGIYDVKAEQRGFNNTTLTGVRVAGSMSAQGNIRLNVGSVSESVEISARSEAIMTESSMSSAIRGDSGITVDVSTQEVGELFEYRIAHPVTIRRNSSAMIPIVQSKVEGESVSLYNAGKLKQHPLSAIYLTNNTGLTLESGPVTVIEGDTYSGEALLGRVKPGEKRFFTYAVDLGCRVSSREKEESSKAFLAEIINGEFRVHYKQAKATTYTLTNVMPRPKTVYLEHPRDKDEKWELVNTPPPVETTENFRRFRVVVAPNSATDFTVNEELPDVNKYQLSNLTTDNIQLFVSSNYLTPQMKLALDGVLELKAQIAGVNKQAQGKQQQINTLAKDQERMRENLKALGKSVEERQLVARYVTKLSQGEDQLERLRAEEQKLTEQRDTLQKQLDDLLRRLVLENRLTG